MSIFYFYIWQDFTFISTDRLYHCRIVNWYCETALLQDISMGAAVVNEGNAVGTSLVVNSQIKCEKTYDFKDGRNSFVFCLEDLNKVKCYPEDKILAGSEPKNKFYLLRKTCDTFRKVHVTLSQKRHAFI